MRPKTIVMLLIVVLLIVMILALAHNPNSGVIFGDMPKTEVTVTAVVLSFVLGFMAGRPGRNKKYRDMYDGNSDHEDPDTLSDEDKEYIG